MKKYNLVMTFKTKGNSKANVTVADCLPELNQAQISAVMDTILAQNIFETKTGDLVAKVSAKLVETEETDFGTLV